MAETPGYAPMDETHYVGDGCSPPHTSPTRMVDEVLATKASTFVAIARHHGRSDDDIRTAPWAICWALDSP